MRMYYTARDAGGNLLAIRDTKELAERAATEINGGTPSDYYVDDEAFDSASMPNEYVPWTREQAVECITTILAEKSFRDDAESVHPSAAEKVVDQMPTTESELDDQGQALTLRELVRLASHDVFREYECEA